MNVVELIIRGKQYMEVLKGWGEEEIVSGGVGWVVWGGWMGGEGYMESEEIERWWFILCGERR